MTVLFNLETEESSTFQQNCSKVIGIQRDQESSNSNISSYILIDESNNNAYFVDWFDGNKTIIYDTIPELIEEVRLIKDGLYSVGMGNNNYTYINMKTLEINIESGLEYSNYGRISEVRVLYYPEKNRNYILFEQKIVVVHLSEEDIEKRLVYLPYSVILTTDSKPYFSLITTNENGDTGFFDFNLEKLILIEDFKIEGYYSKTISYHRIDGKEGILLGCLTKLCMFTLTGQTLYCIDFTSASFQVFGGKYISIDEVFEDLHHYNQITMEGLVALSKTKYTSNTFERFLNEGQLLILKMSYQPEYRFVLLENSDDIDCGINLINYATSVQFVAYRSETKVVYYHDNRQLFALNIEKCTTSSLSLREIDGDCFVFQFEDQPHLDLFIIHCQLTRQYTVIQSSSLLQVARFQAGIDIKYDFVSITQAYTVFSNQLNTFVFEQNLNLNYVRFDELFDKRFTRITYSKTLSYLNTSNDIVTGTQIFHKLDYNIFTEAFLHSTIHALGSSNPDSFEFILNSEIPSFKLITYFTISEGYVLACSNTALCLVINLEENRIESTMSVIAEEEEEEQQQISSIEYQKNESILLAFIKSIDNTMTMFKLTKNSVLFFERQYFSNSVIIFNEVIDFKDGIVILRSTSGITQISFYDVLESKDIIISIQSNENVLYFKYFREKSIGAIILSSSIRLYYDSYNILNLSIPGTISNALIFSVGEKLYALIDFTDPSVYIIHLTDYQFNADIAWEDFRKTHIIQKFQKACNSSNLRILDYPAVIIFKCGYSVHVFEKDTMTMKYMFKLNFFLTSRINDVILLDFDVFILRFDSSLLIGGYDFNSKKFKSIKYFENLENPTIVYSKAEEGRTNRNIQEISIKIIFTTQYKVMRYEVNWKKEYSLNNLKLQFRNQKEANAISIHTTSAFYLRENRINILQLIYLFNSNLTQFEIDPLNFYPTCQLVISTSLPASNDQRYFQLQLNPSSNQFNKIFKTIEFVNSQLDFNISKQSYFINPVSQINKIRISNCLFTIVNSQLKTNNQVTFSNLETLMMNEIKITGIQIFSGLFAFDNINLVIIDTILFENLIAQDQNLNENSNVNPPFLSFSNINKLVIRNITFKSTSELNFSLIQTEHINEFNLENLAISDVYYKPIDGQISSQISIIALKNTHKIVIYNCTLDRINVSTESNLSDTFIILIKVISGNSRIEIDGITLRNSSNVQIVNFITEDELIGENSTFSIANLVVSQIKLYHSLVLFDMLNHVILSQISMNDIEFKGNFNILDFKRISNVTIDGFSLLKSYNNPDNKQNRMLVDESDQLSMVGTLFAAHGVNYLTTKNGAVSQCMGLNIYDVSSFSEDESPLEYISYQIDIKNVTVSEINVWSTYSMVNLLSQIINIEENTWKNLNELVTPVFNLTAKQELRVIKLKVHGLNLERTPAMIVDNSQIAFIADSEFEQIVSSYETACLKILNSVDIFLESVKFMQSENLSEDIEGGCVNISDSDTLEVNKSSFQLCTSSANGGALAVSNVRLIGISDSIFKSNSSKKLSGGALFLSSIQSLIIDTSYFMENTSLEERGGAISIESTLLKITNSIFSSNVAVIGGAVYYDKTTSTIEKVDSSFENNRGFLYGNNMGSLPYKLKGEKLDNTMQGQQKEKNNEVYLNNFQSGNYTYETVFVNFYDEEDNQFDFMSYFQLSSTSSSIQYFFSDLAIEVVEKKHLNNQNDFQILSGDILQFDYFVGQFKLNVSAVYKYGVQDVNEKIFEFLLRSNLKDIQLETSAFLQFRECRIGEIMSVQNGFIRCAECQEGFYSFSDPLTLDQTCLKCPIDALSCQGSSVILKDNYWKVSQYSNKIQKCELKGCSDSSNLSKNTCLPGYIGTLCGSCDDKNAIWKDHKYGRTQDRCVVCKQSYALLKIIVIPLLLSLWLTFWATINIKQMVALIRAEYIKKMNLLFLSRSLAVGMDSSTLWKLFINFIQITAIQKTFLVNLSDFERILFEFLGDPLRLILFESDCLDSNSIPTWGKRLLVSFIGLLVITILVLSLQPVESKSQFRPKFLIMSLSVLLFYFYPSIIRIILELTICRNIFENYILIGDMKQDCSETISMLVRYGILIPLLIVLCLVIPTIVAVVISKEKKQRQLNSIRVRFNWSFLLSGYTKKHMFWEIFRMIMKVLVCVIHTFPIEDLKKILLIEVTLYCYLVVLKQLKPYTNRDHLNYEKSLTMTSVISGLVLGILHSSIDSTSILTFLNSIVRFLNFLSFAITLVFYFKLKDIRSLTGFSSLDRIQDRLFESKWIKSYLKPKRHDITRVSQLWRKLRIHTLKGNQSQFISSSPDYRISQFIKWDAKGERSEIGIKNLLSSARSENGILCSPEKERRYATEMLNTTGVDVTSLPISSRTKAQLDTNISTKRR